MIRRLLTAIIFCAALHARGEMPYMEEFSRKLSVGVGLQTQNYSFDMAGGAGLTFEPNVGSQTVYTVNYVGLGGFSYGVRQGVQDTKTIKGDTRFVDFRYNFPYRQLNVFLFYSRFKGFFLSNSNSVDSGRPYSSPFILFPDLYAQNMGGNLTWVWSPENFSLSSIIDMTERQVKSGGSILTGVAATETIFRNKGAIIPTQVKGTYGNDAEMYEGRVRALSAKVGWGYTEVFRKRWFTSVLGSVGVGPQEVRVSTPSTDYSILRMGLNLVEVYAVVGFNGDQFFSGFNVYTSNAQYQAEKAEISTKLTTAGFFLGTRI